MSRKWYILVGILLASVFWIPSSYFSIWYQQEQYTIGYKDGAEAEKSFFEYKQPTTGDIENGKGSIPLYLQKDPSWKDVSYAGGTVGDNGCGLVSLCMALDYLNGSHVTPDKLAGIGNENWTTDSMTDPDMMCEYASREWNIKWDGEAWDFDSALDEVSNGAVCIASMSGKLGERTYQSHIVLVYKVADGNIYLRDPDDGTNSITPFTREDLSEATWGPFNVLKV